MALMPGHKANFETLQLAVRNGDLALLECHDAQTGDMVAALCAINHVGDEYEFVPLAKLFNGNPFDELVPPA